MQYRFLRWRKNAHRGGLLVKNVPIEHKVVKPNEGGFVNDLIA